ncbi:Gfo/Idh/MocA family oxidoreductase [Leptobacterium flavescens]|uniref:Gfo/Idh/MocA family oxidoreductase n=1 Tax=Leptobacterium flavescens TaxID=472055 RepID=A0A6P0UPM4_9FLAO|nr:Gfo/Idh/MocA family oxidoreductase [Leptobacterium flavescens]NER14420.1 Gfo/Idh/MocA family oxidoreductase [Leptobacterium flavescens]
MSNQTPSEKKTSKESRRDFIKKTSVFGTGIILARPFGIRASTFSVFDQVNVAVVGCGGRGSGIIFSNIPKIEGCNLVAVCDVIESRRENAKRRFKEQHGKTVNAYEDFYEMLEKEKLDAVVLATPDFWHAPHAIDALNAGLHVYCEKAMSNRLKDARKMAETMKKTGKYLQIGRQRRSNDRYRFTYKNLIQKEKMFGRLTHATGQWNRSKIWTQMPNKKDNIDLNKLRKYGFESIDQVYNWRNYKKLGGGVVSDLGSHQIDIFNWFFNAYPKTVYATGNNSYFGYEQADTMATILEYDTPSGPAIGIYENISNSRAIGVYERFIGDQGAFIISEGKDNKIYRESAVEASKWQKYIDKGYIENEAGLAKYKAKEVGDSGIKETAPQISYKIDQIKDMDVVYNLPAHTAHLKNFIETVRGNETLNYDAVESYKSEVCIYKIHDAINNGGKRIRIRASEYEI